MNDFESPKMSPELTAAVTRVQELTAERDRVADVLESERKRFRDQQVSYEEARSILSARESEQALSGGAPDPQFRRNFAAARDELEILGARSEGVGARLAVVERDLDGARAQLGDAFEAWRSAEAAKSADQLMSAMRPLMEAVVVAYATAAALNDSFSKRTLATIRGFSLFDPTAPTSKVLFHGSSCRGGRFRRDANAARLYDDVVAVRLRVSELLAGHAGQAEVVDVPIEEEITK